MTVTRLSDPTPTAVSLATVGAVLPALVIVGVPQPVAAVLGTALLALVPGFALVRLAPPRDPLAVLALSVATSLSLATVVSSALFYTGAWSWQLCSVVLGVVTVAAAPVRPQEGSS